MPFFIGINFDIVRVKKYNYIEKRLHIMCTCTWHFYHIYFNLVLSYGWYIK